MEPEHLKFGGGLSETILNPVVLLIVLAAGLVILISPRGKAIVAFVAVSILIPMDQVLIVAGLHFPMLRILALFGIARLISEKISSKRRVFAGGFNNIDTAVVLFSISTAVAALLLFRDSGMLIFQLGSMYQVFGIYFLLRYLIRNEADVIIIIRTLAYVSAFIALIMAWESLTGHNLYAMLGGGRASLYANVGARDDRFRAQGCFGHAILAGSFGAILLPLFPCLWRRGKGNKAVAVVGMVSATIIAVTANSSTSLLAYAGGVIAMCMWPIRNWMRPVRWGIVLALVCLHMVMHSPVWHLITYLDVAGSSSSYHRYMLVDQCIRHFSDWWFIGVKSTYDWGWDMWDTANQYVSVCDSSGLVPFICFMATIVFGFKYIGKARRRAREPKQEVLMWLLGCALFANAVAFVGISYWDQTQVAWYSLLAAISAVAIVRPKRPLRKPLANASELTPYNGQEEARCAVFGGNSLH